jgi:threonine dehydrogenase-like Zn-dependent dehydrogenase
LRVPQAHFGPIRVPEGAPDERYLFLSHVVPAAWQAVRYAEVPAGGTLAVLGLGPIGQLAARIGRHLGAVRVLGVDDVDVRLRMAARHGVETLDMRVVDDVAEALIEVTGGRGPDSVIDAVGMQAHRCTRGGLGEVAQAAVSVLPAAVATPHADTLAVDRLDALLAALRAVRRGGTVSLSGVYGGEVDPMPMMDMFDRGIQLRMGQAHVKRWIEEIMPLVCADDDPLGVLDLTTHRLPLEDAARGYEMFRKQQDDCIKVVLHP